MPQTRERLLKDKIHHIHWKDLGPEWEAKRGTEYGCGFSNIALGDGVVDIKGVCEVLRGCGIAGSTLEIIGDDSVLLRSVDYLKQCGMGA